MNFAIQFLYSKGLGQRDAVDDSEPEEDSDPFWSSCVQTLFSDNGNKNATKKNQPPLTSKDQGQKNCLVPCDQNGPRPLAINPERLKGFVEEEHFNGELSTWEMNVAGSAEELLKESVEPTAQKNRKPSIRPKNDFLRFEDISAAAFKIQGGVQKTPCMYSRISKQYGVDIYLKKEFLQYIGSVKERGVLYLLTSLSQDQQKKGVIVATDSNFAMAVAFHASELQIPAFVIMSAGTSPGRVKMCRDYGAMVILFGPTARDARSHAMRLAEENGYLYMEEEDSAAYLAGLGTVGLEIYEQMPCLDVVIFPAGGHCGLLAASAAALKHLNPKISVIGVESAKFPIVQESLKIGHCMTEHDWITHPLYGELGGPSFGGNTLKLTKKLVDKVISVREEDVLLAMLRLLEYERVTADAEGSMGLAALIAGALPDFKGKKVGVVVCSANLSLPLLRHCLDRALVLDHRVCKFSIVLPDFPWEITKLMEAIGREEARVLDMRKENIFPNTDLFTLEVTCVVETRDKTHATQLRNTLSEKYPAAQWISQ
ncbi:L-threonine ammonia-lyase-like isoform X2 [Spea bombifrons]|uniref:L-threonine ammonia-lyase-like isoform X2 n=1 Tax=Spea bombifrons TaxID=233779 RepID=UPI00234A368E|nr:L-threonine ammonia-lyase-like isoform X2 [Spea bombifrons]